MGRAYEKYFCSMLESFLGELEIDEGSRKIGQRTQVLQDK